MGPVCESVGRLLAVWASLWVCVSAAPPVLKAHFDCGEQGVQLVASLVPWPPGHRVLFKILDEFGNAKDLEDCWACKYWVTTGPKGEAVLVIQYTGCYVSHKEDHFNLKVRVLQLHESVVSPLSKDVNIVCPKPSAKDSSRQLPLPWGVQSSTVAQEQASSTIAQEQASPQSLGNSTVLPSVCQVASGKIPCEGTSSSMDACLSSGCCYDSSDQNASCYYGNKATILCTPDGFFLVVVSRSMLGHLVLLDTIHLADTGPYCSPQVVTESFQLFHFPLGQCGTTVQLLNDRIVYENELKSMIDVLHSGNASITRDSPFMLHLRCSYNTTDSLPVAAEVFTLPPPQPISVAGPLRLEMRIAKDSLYSEYYSETEYPVVKILQEPIFLEVRLLQREDPSLMLVLEQCWAAPTANPVQQPQWPVLIDGCPFAGDNYQTRPAFLDGKLQFPSHYSRFTVATFTFVESASPLPSGGQVFFFCSASVCRPSPGELCIPQCFPPGGRSKRFLGFHLAEDQPVSLAVSSGPVVLQEDTVVERKKESLPDFPTLPALALTWLPVAAGVAMGMAISLLALAVLFWRSLWDVVIASAVHD